MSDLDVFLTLYGLMGGAAVWLLADISQEIGRIRKFLESRDERR